MQIKNTAVHTISMYVRHDYRFEEVRLFSFGDFPYEIYTQGFLTIAEFLARTSSKHFTRKNHSFSTIQFLFIVFLEFRASGAGSYEVKQLANSPVINTGIPKTYFTYVINT